MPTKTHYNVNRVRLINFHNFIDETIEIHDGGHLFLLGDNGSGKTTLLDAIHLVLAGMDGMEFNAAARVVGNAQGGRRPVGIILRQNVEKIHPLNPNGGITYAAVELLGKDGKYLCLAIGMMARSLEDRVSWWGAIKSCRLDDLPFLKNTTVGTVPLNQAEFRKQLEDERSFCSSHTAYRKKLGNRLYGSKEEDGSLFNEMRRLLRMGKAYREIAAGTSDYHELFKKLLPEPKKETFNDVIQTLRELEQSNSELVGLEDRQRYLETLQELVDKIEQHRETALRYQWLIHYLNIQNLEKQLQKNDAERKSAETGRENCHSTISSKKQEKNQLQQALNTLKQQDSSGILQKREELSQRFSDLKEEIGQNKQTEHNLEHNLTLSQQEATSAELEHQSILKSFYGNFSRLNPKLPFSIAGLLRQIDEQIRLDNPTSAEVPVTDEIDEKTESEYLSLLNKRNSINQKFERLKECLEKVESEIHELQTRQDLIPPMDNFVEAQKALKQGMINATPLYEGLEWHFGVSINDQTAIEETIGFEVLGTFIVSAEDKDMAEEIIFKSYPGIGIAVPELPEQGVPDWIRRAFDIASSDPDAINVLIEEMQAKHHPEFDQKLDWNELHFRAHGRRLVGSSLGLIGSEQRKRAMQRKIRTLKQELKQIGGAIREQEKQQKENDQAYQILEKLKGYLRELPHVLGKRIRIAQYSKQQEIHARQKLEDFLITLKSKQNEMQNIEGQLFDIQAKIEQQGLDKLEKKQRVLERKLEAIERETANLNQKLGSITTELDNLKRHQEILHGNQVKEEALLAEVAELLKPCAELVESVEYYVMKTNRGQQFTSVENVQQEFERNDREKYETISQINGKLSDPQFGAVYAFYYDRENNSLIDRQQVSIAEVVKAGKREIDEQNQVINDKTQKLIHDLIMGELFVELKASVSILKTMVRKINGKLRDRNFGSARYQFNLAEVPHYSDLLLAVQRFHPHSPEARQELEGFLELHKDEIMNTESGDIPDTLDYRNWFRYDLVVRTVDKQGVVMDRKTKSLGSGGEQAVPNYLLILTVAHLLYEGNDDLRLPVLLFDEAFYGIDTGRRDQLLGFANDLDLQLFIASPDLDGVKKEVAYSTTLLVKKDDNCDVHLFYYNFKNPPQTSLLEESQTQAVLLPVNNDIGEKSINE